MFQIDALKVKNIRIIDTILKKKNSSLSQKKTHNTIHIIKFYLNLKWIFVMPLFLDQIFVIS